MITRTAYDCSKDGLRTMLSVWRKTTKNHSKESRKELARFIRGIRQSAHKTELAIEIWQALPVSLLDVKCTGKAASCHVWQAAIARVSINKEHKRFVSKS